MGDFIAYGLVLNELFPQANTEKQYADSKQ